LILGALNADLQKDATLLIPFIRSKMDGEGKITDISTVENLKTAFRNLLDKL
jgi:hypothetical protein